MAQEIKTLAELYLEVFAVGSPPPLPNAGEVQIYAIDLGSSSLQLKGVDSAGALIIPGALVAEDESLGEVNTTSGTYQQKLSLPVTVLTAGRYRIEWSYETRASTSGTADRRCQSRVHLDNTTVLAEPESSKQQFKSNNSVSTQHTHGGFAYATLTAGAHTVDIDYRRSSSAGTAYIRNARLAVSHA